jgi:hypothetical protein
MRGITISESKTAEVLNMYKKHLSYRIISSKVGISKTQVARIITRNKHGITAKTQGAQKLLTPRQPRVLKRIALQNRKMGVRFIRDRMEIKVSHPTTLRRLHELQLVKKRFRRRPVLTPEHKRKRVSFAMENFPKKESLKKWVFTDEKKFRFDGPDGWNKFWVHKHDKRFKPAMSKDYGKYKGVMVWGAVSSEGLLALERTTPKMSGDDYLKMVTGPPLDKIRSKCGPHPIFIQDNASTHKKLSTVEGLKDSGMEVPEWPALSPDLNPMENVWSLIVKRLYPGSSSFESEDELWEGIKSVGKTITKEDVAPYIDSVPSRFQKVVEKKGGYVQEK